MNRKAQLAQRGKKALTWSKLSRAACKLASMPVGGSLVILMAFSRIPWGKHTGLICLLPLLPCPCSRNVYTRSMQMLNALIWPFCMVYLRNNVFLGCWCRLSTHKHSVIWMTAFTAALQELLKWTQPTANQVDILQGHEWKIKIYISKFS